MSGIVGMLEEYQSLGLYQDWRQLAVEVSIEILLLEAGRAGSL
jgi:hypothetical protein